MPCIYESLITFSSLFSFFSDGIISVLMTSKREILSLVVLERISRAIIIVARCMVYVELREGLVELVVDN